MKQSEIALANQIKKKLVSFRAIHSMPGIANPATLDCFLEQIIDSTRRIRYVQTILNKNVLNTITNPATSAFDPIKASIWFRQNGNIDEAFWLIFLVTHFGKHKNSNWGLLRNVYNGNGTPWTWKRVSANPSAFRAWINSNIPTLKVTGGFGNHRKYESLNGNSPNGTGAVIESYVSWIGSTHKHTNFIKNLQLQVGMDPRKLFGELYRSMSEVRRFGRTAKFDYLTMLGKLKLVDIEPPSTYMSGATGPARGAQLLFTQNSAPKKTTKQLNSLTDLLESHLELYFGMQVLEDALCNWQKSPEKYIHFTG